MSKTPPRTPEWGLVFRWVSFVLLVASFAVGCRRGPGAAIAYPVLMFFALSIVQASIATAMERRGFSHTPKQASKKTKRFKLQ